MKTSGFISKSMACLLLTVMLYMHLCSALCAIGSVGSSVKEDDENYKKSCCTEEKDADGKKHDCQDMHLSFFNTTGQFAFEKTVDVIKVFHTFFAVVTPLFIIQPVEANKNILACNGFHPPPPKAGIRIFIQSFQI